VLVATVRALKMHGGAAKENLGKVNMPALVKGAENLARHVENVRKFGVPVIVAINRFSTDDEAELDMLRQVCAELEAEAIVADHWAKGSAGTEDLAHAAVRTIDEQPSQFRFIYDDKMSLWDKVRTLAQVTYGAQGIIADKAIRARFAEMQEAGFGHYPVCIAKTQYSFSTDPNLRGAPSNHVIPVREIRLAGGAEFLVVICGDIMTMPGLPKTPSANGIGVDGNGEIYGIF
jgi:formate--tetrahydrofolate ligase